MALSAGSSGFGTLFKRGDGGVGAGTQASKTVGSSNQELIFKAETAGTAGNSMQAGIVVSGNNTSFSYAISSTSLVITSATDGGGLATTTVYDAIVAIQDDPIYRSYWELSTGGDGSGVLVAAATANLTSGANGTEVFTTVAEVTGLRVAGRTLELIDSTHMESPDAHREYLPSLLDSGEVQIDLNFLPGDSNHQGFEDDRLNRVRRNFQIVWTDTDLTTYGFAAYITGFDISAVIDDKLSGTATVKITGPISGAGTP